MSDEKPAVASKNPEVDLLHMAEAGQADIAAAFEAEMVAVGLDCHHRFFDKRKRQVILTWTCAPDPAKQGKLEGEFTVKSKMPAQHGGRKDFKVGSDGIIRAIPDPDENQRKFEDIAPDEQVDTDTGEVTENDPHGRPTASPGIPRLASS